MRGELLAGCIGLERFLREEVAAEEERAAEEVGGDEEGGVGGGLVQQDLVAVFEEAVGVGEATALR